MASQNAGIDTVLRENRINKYYPSGGELIIAGAPNEWLVPVRINEDALNSKEADHEEMIAYSRVTTMTKNQQEKQAMSNEVAQEQIISVLEEPLLSLVVGSGR
ncbi:MAG: hypothetical protein IPL73_23705 [Candidatus Obscuribacter sp.]|nr:hypothetical protein [Candidatus Obscuribacter sp.]